MTSRGGFAGRILHVNLTTGDTRSQALNRDLARRLIGGYGVGSWLVHDMIKSEIDPMSPENTIVYSAGPLVGTIAPASSRIHLTSRSPDSGFLLWSNAGHSAGIMLKYAGYDHLIITGRAERPSYIRVEDDDVEILEADQLWGKNTRETTSALEKKHPGHLVDCIGPAGEKGIRYSIVLCGGRSSFNKMGPGTVMGSKNLKAIVARGTKGVKVADPERFRKLTDAIAKDIATDPDLDIYRTVGEPTTDRPGFTGEEFRQRVAERPYACISCPVACKHLINLRGGKYDGLRYRISHLDALSRHNSLADPKGWDELAKLVEFENQVGIEASSTAGMLSYLSECTKRGYAFSSDPLLQEKGVAAMRHLVSLMMKGEGVGPVAAKGLLHATNHFGRETEAYAQHTKSIGLKQAFDRQVSNFDFGLLTNPRAKGELSHVPYGSGNTIDLETSTIRKFCGDLGLSEKTTNKTCDGPDGFDVVRLVRRLEDYSATYLALGFCDRAIVMRHVNLGKLTELYSAATGLEVTPGDFLLAGERIVNLLKLINLRFGATRIDDLPSRGATFSPGKHILFRGADYGSLDEMLNRYYSERGWDVETGVPENKTLQRLGL